nr:carboxypeptidase regulatory-like domain-containing protein [Gemmatimonadaceae bacterium]
MALSLGTGFTVAAMAAMLTLPPSALSAQVVTGILRSPDGEPLASAIIAVADVAGARSDAAGHYTISGFRPGSYRLVARRIGRVLRDTTITVGAGDTVHWNPVLPESEPFGPSAEEVRRSEAARSAAGSIDSIASGAVSTDSSGILTYERFGIELLRAALTPGIPPVASRGGGAGDSATLLDTNRVLSPLSAGQALVIAWGAAVDSTAHVIQQALRIGAVDLN